MRLIDGAEALRGDLPIGATVRVDVPLGAGSSQGSDVHRLSSLIAVRDAQEAALSAGTGLAITIGGDCGVELAAIGHAASGGGELAVLWIDAHPDIHTAESSPSGAFHGMVVRSLLGEGVPELIPATPIVASRLILAGTRALDDAEQQFVEESGIRMLTPTGLTPAAVTAALGESGASALYIHVDLDVLDPAEFSGLTFPEPFGLTLAQLVEVIAAAKAALPLAGAGVTEFAPSSPDAAADDLGSILRIIGALAA
jgi:arginase